MNRGLLLAAPALCLLSGCAEISDLRADLPLLTAPDPQPVPPLELLTRLQLPAYVHTVHDAADYLLEPSGYRLVTTCDLCPAEGAEIARKPISPLGLHPQITTIKRAVLLVSGSGVHLLVDDSARQVAFAYASPSP
jgi:hypothetical protein